MNPISGTFFRAAFAAMALSYAAIFTSISHAALEEDLVSELNETAIKELEAKMAAADETPGPVQEKEKAADPKKKASPAPSSDADTSEARAEAYSLDDRVKILMIEDEKGEAPPRPKPLLTLGKELEERDRPGGFRIFMRDKGDSDVGTYAIGKAGALSLKDCINIAIENHLPLRIAKKNVKLAEMRVNEAKRNMLPSATVAYEETYGTVYGRKYYGRKQYVEGQQPVFHGGELFFTLKQAETNLGIVRNDYEKTKNELMLQVKKGYYTLIKAMENLKIQRHLARDVEMVTDMVMKQHEANIATKLEYLNVSSQAGQVRYQIASAEGDLSVADMILKQAMNMDPKQKLEVVVPASLELKKVDVDFDTALRAAFLSRPEIRINTLMTEYYNYGKGIARAKGWPKIDIMGQWGLAKEEYMSEDAGPDPVTASNSAIDQKLSQQWYAGVKASMPVWGSTAEYAWTREQWVPVISAYQGTEAATNSMKLKVLDKLDYYSDKQLSDIDFDRARQELIKIRQDVALEVRETCFAYEKALIQAQTASSKVRYQEKDLEVLKAKRGMDEALDSNVVESMIKLAQERFGYIQALTDCHISLASVNKAIGVEDYFKDEVEASP